MAETFDLVVIGSGPGGYVCAIKAAQLGMNVGIVEKRATFGGTCLNVGCIPSKALLHASEMFHEAQHGFEKLGIDVSKPKIDLKKMMKHKEDVVSANVDGVAFLLKKNNVTSFIGTGTITQAGKITVTDEKGKKELIEAKNIVIATGSKVAGIPGVDVTFDKEIIVSSDNAIALKNVPKKLIVIGGGIIGLELGSVWSRLGAEVTVVEFLPNILGGMDKSVIKLMQRTLKKQGFVFKLSAKVTKVEKKGKKGIVSYEPVAGGKAEKLEGDVVLVATGRVPMTDELGLDKIGVAMERGRVVTNEHWETNVKGIYAIGDATNGPMLAHKAEEEGVAVAEILSGQVGHVNYNVIPAVLYTNPEVASVGKTQEELEKEGVEFVAGEFPFSANGRARSMNSAEGFVKFLADKKTDRVLGCHIVAHAAGELIHEVCVLMEFGGSSEDLARICHAHPTLSEAVREASMATSSLPIHI